MNQELIEKVKTYKLQGASDEYIISQCEPLYAKEDVARALHMLRYVKYDQQNPGMSTDASVKEIRTPWVEIGIIGVIAPVVTFFFIIGAFMSLLPLAGLIFSSVLIYSALIPLFFPFILISIPFVLVFVANWVVFYLLYLKRYSIPWPRWTSFNTLLLIILSIELIFAAQMGAVLSGLYVSVLGALTMIGMVKASFIELGRKKKLLYFGISCISLVAIVIVTQFIRDTMQMY